MKSKFISGIFFILLLLFSLNNLIAQENETPSDNRKPSSRFFTGGNIGLQFGSQTMIEASPILGYKITDNFSAGIGFTYQYYRLNLYGTIFKTYIYGGSVFARYYIFENFFIHGEYEALNLETAFFDPGSLFHKGERYWIGSVLGGGGYRQPIGGNSYLNIMVLYNFNDNPYSPYDGPLIYRVGIDIGL